MPTVIIRADASTQIGSGHIMRCLTIAQQLKAKQVEVLFMMANLQGNLIAYVESQGFQTITAYENANLYIIDHYEIDYKEEQIIRGFTEKIMVIDDLANRKHDCNILLDQNVVPHFENRYEEYVPTYCKKLLGPRYLIMREEFVIARKNMITRDFSIDNLLVFMGGTDPTNETLKVLNALEGLQYTTVNIVVGNGNEEKEKIKQLCEAKGYHYHQQINYMAKLMQEADFCIGAGGGTMWERCYIGLPSSSTIVAENQRLTTNYAQQLGAVYNLGWHEDVTSTTYKEVLQNTVTKQALQQMHNVGLHLTATKKPNIWLNEILELIR